MAAERTYRIFIHDDGDGMLWGEVEGLPGCFASGADTDELLNAAAEAITMYLAESGLPQVDNVVQFTPRAAAPVMSADDPDFAVREASIAL